MSALSNDGASVKASRYRNIVEWIDVCNNNKQQVTFKELSLHCLAEGFLPNKKTLEGWVDELTYMGLVREDLGGFFHVDHPELLTMFDGGRGKPKPKGKRS